MNAYTYVHLDGYGTGMDPWTRHATGCSGWRCCSQLLPLLVVLFIGVIAPCTSLSAQEESGQRKPALPGEPCQTTPYPSWTPQEKWVWERICVGKVADFNSAEGYGGKLDPKDSDAWQKWEGRILRPGFLETLLLHKPWRDAVPRQGVRIVGAWFREPLDLSNAELTCDLWLDDSRFESTVDLSSLRTSHTLSLNGSTVTGELILYSLHVGGDLLMGDGATFATVDLADAQIEGHLSFVGVEVTGRLHMNGLRVGRTLSMYDGATFATVDLISAQIEGQLNLTRATVTGELHMGGLHVGDSLIMRQTTIGEPTAPAKVVLRGAHVEANMEIAEATVTGELHMDGLHVGGNLIMRQTTIGEPTAPAKMVLRDAHIRAILEIYGGKVTGELHMDGLHVGGDLLMSNEAKFTTLNLAHAQIEGQLSLARVEVTDCLQMNGLRVERGLFMRDKAKVATVALTSAQIKDQLAFDGVEVSGRLHMNGLRVSGSLFIRDGAKVATVDLTSAQIEGQFGFVEVKVTGKLHMDGLHVGDSLIMRGGDFAKAPPIFITFATIGSNLDLSGVSLPSLDLTATTIGGQLRLTQGSTTWQPRAQLTLRNTKVGTLVEQVRQVNPGAPAAETWATWPATLDLTGFTYDRLGGENVPDMAARRVKWWKDWLRKQKKYAPQTYEQLAKVLRESGYQTKATQILYTGKERERAEAHWGLWIWLTLLWGTIGYGYYPWYALPWTILFIACGMGVLWWSGQYQEHDLQYLGLAYSVDMFLPIIELRKKHYDIDLSRWPRGYFYVHKAVGYVLALFLVAGLSGLTR